ncbi:MAG: hypothetical protein JRG72_11590, partial [Deltaproteobacteria bacterium]|nr:hypothetical protein [Deltaproteobacteria bacterium]
MFSYLSPEARVLQDHRLRPIRKMVNQALAEPLSDEHFTVDGTLIEAWASLKSFRRKDAPPPSGGGRNP